MSNKAKVERHGITTRHRVRVSAYDLFISTVQVIKESGTDISKTAIPLAANELDAEFGLLIALKVVLFPAR